MIIFFSQTINQIFNKSVNKLAKNTSNFLIYNWKNLSLVFGNVNHRGPSFVFSGSSKICFKELSFHLQNIHISSTQIVRIKVFFWVILPILVLILGFGFVLSLFLLTFPSWRLFWTEKMKAQVNFSPMHMRTSDSNFILTFWHCRLIKSFWIESTQE